MAEKMTVYLADTAPLLDEALFACLLPKVTDERRRLIAPLRFPGDRARSLAAGLLLRQALLDAGEDESALRLAYGERGKPYYVNQPALHFNLSHAGQRAMCVLAPHPVGCDLEPAHRAAKGVAERCFTPDECAAFLQAPDGLSRLWTAKESFLKCIGMGLLLPMREFSVEPDGDSLRVRQSVDGGDYRIYEIPIDGYRCAVCLRDAARIAPTVRTIALSE